MNQQCLECTQQLNRGKKFCSNVCWGKHRTKNRIPAGGPKKIRTLPRPCKYCNESYVPHNGKQKFCSRHCMGMARREDFINNTKTLAYKNGVTEETRNKMSLAASKRNASRVYTKGIGGTRDDIGHYVRSKWEANFARYLIHTKQSYQYESENFTLNIDDRKCPKTKIRYTPDFKVENKFYEVKGWWDKRSILIKRLMLEQYPEIKIEYIDQEKYLELEKNFKGKINEWESK